jgi:hypothetical protein
MERWNIYRCDTISNVRLLEGRIAQKQAIRHGGAHVQAGSWLAVPQQRRALTQTSTATTTRDSHMNTYDDVVGFVSDSYDICV